MQGWVDWLVLKGALVQRVARNADAEDGQCKSVATTCRRPEGLREEMSLVL
jgi:hypothetical protein